MEKRAVVLLFLANLLMSAACKCPPSPPKEKPSCPPTKPPRRTPPPPSPGPPRRPPPRSPPPPSPGSPRPPPPRTPPAPPPVVPSPSPGRCPIDALKLGACVDLLSSLVHVVIGSELKRKCCPVIQGLVGLDAAVCFCTAIRAKLLNLTLLLPIALQLILGCGQTIPPGFVCPP